MTGDLMRMIILVLVLSVVAFGDVIPGTLHYSDACEVDELMEAAGVYSGRVKILNFESLIVYAIEFPGDYFSWNSSDDVAEVSAAFIAVAAVSASTSWHSDVVIVLYEDDTIGMFTVDCRTAVRYVNAGYDITDFLMRNVLMGERETSQLSL
jgi:hypothetical protein